MDQILLLAPVTTLLRDPQGTNMTTKVCPTLLKDPNGLLYIPGVSTTHCKDPTQINNLPRNTPTSCEDPNYQELILPHVKILEDLILLSQSVLKGDT